MMTVLIILLHSFGTAVVLCLAMDLPRKSERELVLMGLRRKDLSLWSVTTKLYLAGSIVYLGYWIWRLLTW